MTNQATILSGIQPSGQLGIGHYIGAIRNWVELQQQYHCLFMLADLHTLTVKQDPVVFRQRCLELLALYIACGIDVNRVVLFAQSHVPAHTKLGWILNCYTPMGDLSRMTQFKDKSKQHAANINAGLFSYPVLMAADILLYQAKYVPVGDDQKQHLELTRDIAIRFNNIYGPVFTVPEAYIAKQGARIMSLQEPSQKMSKSDPNEFSFIALLDSPEQIISKLKRSVTDSGNEIRFDPVNKPGISNLLTLFSSVSDQSIAELEQTFQGSGYGKFKLAVADAIIERLKPIQAAYYELMANQSQLHQILADGAKKAQDQAEKTMSKVEEVVGLLPQH